MSPRLDLRPETPKYPADPWVAVLWILVLCGVTARALAYFLG